MEQEPRVVRRYLQLRYGKRSEIIASDVYDELPVLTCEAGGVCGHTYPKAQGLLALKAAPEADGQVRLDLVPEVHYGEPRQRYVGEGAALVLQAGQARKAFDDLTITAVLPPGHMLLIGSLDSRPGTLGHQFFTCKSNGRLEQKLLLIRLAQRNTTVRSMRAKRCRGRSWKSKGPATLTRTSVAGRGIRPSGPRRGTGRPHA